MDLFSAEAWKDWWSAAKGRIDVADQEVIVALREELVNQRMENLTLREQLMEIKEQAAPSLTLEFDEPMFYEVGDTERRAPYCPGCWQGSEKLAARAMRLDNGTFLCSVCNHGW